MLACIGSVVILPVELINKVEVSGSKSNSV